jgi:protein-S-isoprenylcysteine O-methyltransferase Ste14
MSVLRRIARLRVPIGFLSGAVVLWLAHPTLRTLTVGAIVAAAGEAIRVWAAGHLEKGREVTTTGPYTLTRHPLYVGSTIIGIGLSIACASVAIGALVLTYLAVTLTAAVRTEEAHLTEKFGEAYPDYRAGRVATEARRFSLARAWRNREYRAMVGLLAAIGVLALKTWLVEIYIGSG